MNRFPHMPTLLLVLFALAGCEAERASAPLVAPESPPQPERAEQNVVASTAARAPAKPAPVQNEANLAMMRAAEGPEVKLLPCSTMSGAEYDACVATNAAAIRAASGQ